MKRIAILLIPCALAMAAAVKQPLTVTPVSSEEKVVSTGVHCSGSTTQTTPTQTVGNSSCRETGIHFVTNVVDGSDGNRYTLGCTARFIWQACPTFIVDPTKPPMKAEIKGGSMTVYGHPGGYNQLKEKHHAYKIMDIRPIPPPPVKE